MTAYDFLDPASLREDRDAPLVAGLAGPSAPPIFVLGLHRSGTTWLTQALADALPLATPTLYHVTHYRRLLWAREQGLEPTYHADLARVLAARGVADRGIDGTPVGPHAPEEYAFILRKFAGSWGTRPAAVPLLREILAKLTALHPTAPALLLKNPFDFAHAPALLGAFPDARFVFIRRDPLRVLNSQFRNHFVYRRGEEPYLALLLAGIPLWELNFAVLAAADRWLPDGLYQALAVQAIQRGLQTQLGRHYATLDRLPAGRYVEVSYEAMLADPPATLGRVREFLGLPWRPDAVMPAPRPRVEDLQPAVAAHAPAVRRALAAFPDARLGESLTA